jgi:predicted signal transduction protein with EAL and GGDEF domain
MERTPDPAPPPPAVVFVDDDGDAVEVTPAWMDLTGQPAGAAIGAGWLAAVHGDDRDVLLGTIRRAGATGLPLSHRTQVRNGERRHDVHVDVVPVLGPGSGTGRSALRGSVAVVVRDVTAATRAVAERARLARVVALSNDVIVVSAADGTVELANGPAQLLLGGRRVEAALAPESARRYRDVACPAAQATGVWSGELDMVLTDGLRIPVAATLLADDAPDGPRRTLTLIARDISELKAAQHRLERLATCEPVTGLANRRGLLAHLRHQLGRAARQGGAVGVVAVAVERPLGTPADTHARRVADGLRRSARAEDLVARFDDDRYVVVCADLAAADGPSTPEAPEALLGPVLDRIRRALDAAGAAGTPAGRVRIGTAVVRPEADTAPAATAAAPAAAAAAPAAAPDPDELLARALRALLHPGVDAGADAGADAGVGAPGATDHGAEVAPALVLDIADAIAEGTVGVGFQPIVRLADGAVVGFEAMVRWLHPDRGPVAPGATVAAAAAAGQAGNLARLVLHQAARHAITWAALRPDDAPLVTVNTTAEHLVGTTLADLVAAAVDEQGSAPEMLAVEVDAAATGNFATAFALDVVAEFGARVVVDLAGDPTGDPTPVTVAPGTIGVTVHAVKVPIRPTPDAESVAAWRRHGCVVIATGLESADDVAAAVRAGADLGQGFHLAGVLGPTDAQALLLGRAHLPVVAEPGPDPRPDPRPDPGPDPGPDPRPDRLSRPRPSQEM